MHLSDLTRKGNGNVDATKILKERYRMKPPGTAGVNGSHPRGATMLKGEGETGRRERRRIKEGKGGLRLQ